MEIMSPYESDFQANNTLDLVKMNVEHEYTYVHTHLH